MRKQVNLKAKFLRGEKVKTKNILNRVKQECGLKEFLIMKILLKLSNYASNADIGFIKYCTVLHAANKSKNTIQLLRHQFGYHITGDTVDEMTQDDWEYISKFRFFSIPTDAILKLDMKRIQKALAKSPYVIKN